tara:strand:- start:827 stop:973 length:147 start_codon:yes stop_codon:yes gene_type:complete
VARRGGVRGAKTAEASMGEVVRAVEVAEAARAMAWASTVARRCACDEL